ncbi:MAG: hypothetical protein HPY66_2276 [Firmicutes bacterium]|nr:hypothetical protein [Bacillota bacterium]
MVLDKRNIENHPHLILQHLKGIDLDTSLVYIAGSLMEGFGNETSDIDVYVICKDISTDRFRGDPSSEELILSTQQAIVRNIRHDGIRYDFEYWSWNEFNQMIAKLNGLDFKTEHYIQRLSETEFDFLHRLKFGRPVINKEKFEEIYKSIQFNNLGFYQIVIKSEFYAGMVEDVQGALLSKDLGSAFFMARMLIDTMVTSYLAAYGETNPSSKWLYRKIIRYQEKTGDKILLSKYLDFQTRPFDETTVERYTKEALWFCQDLNVQVQTILKKKQVS